MDTDDLDPPRRPAGAPDMDPMSIAELEDYIRGLQSEIERARAAIQAKQAHRGGAESLFRKS